MSAPDLGAARAAAEAAVAPWRAENGPGGAVLLFDRSRILAEACGGLADLGLGLAYTPDTANRWASLTKHVFCALVLKRGLSLQARLGDLLPATSQAVGGVSVGRALDMTSGLPDLHEFFAGLGVSSATPMRRPALEAMARTLPALNYAEGAEISYTNTGYRLLQGALEAGGTPLGAQWREAFFDPLGLAISFPHDFAEPVAHLATGYWRDAEGWHEGRYGTHLSASGGLAGSGRTLARWLMALLRGDGPVAGLLDRLAARRTLANGAETFYGLGIAHAPPWLGEPCFGHGGSLPGYKDHFLLAPASGIGVAVLSNREETDALGLALSVMAAWLGRALPPPAPAALPDGLFADPGGGPFWAEHRAGRLTFLGAEEPLFQDGEAAVTRSPYMSMRLARDGDGIAGEINGVARRFVPVSAAVPLDGAWAGVWRNEAHGGRIVISADADGPHLVLGTAPAALGIRLTPLGRGCALGDAWDGPSRRRPCFVLDGDRLRVVTNRARVLEYARAG